MLHALIALPTQLLPPFAGAGLLQLRLRVPPPQAAEHAPNRDQSPFTATHDMNQSMIAGDRQWLVVGLHKHKCTAQSNTHTMHWRNKHT